MLLSLILLRFLHGSVIVPDTNPVVAASLILSAPLKLTTFMFCYYVRAVSGGFLLLLGFPVIADDPSFCSWHPINFAGTLMFAGNQICASILYFCWHPDLAIFASNLICAAGYPIFGWHSIVTLIFAGNLTFFSEIFAVTEDLASVNSFI